MSNILIGNIVSFAAAVFLAVSCVVKDKKQVLILQFMNCAVLALASYFFGSYAAISTLALCCVRNVFITKDKFTRPVMTVIVILVIICGVLTNNRGIIGLMPVLATVEYTMCCYFITNIRKTKISILLNETIWLVYSFIVQDYATALTDVAVIIVDIVAILKAPSAVT